MRNSSHYTAAMAADPTLPVADMQIIASERPDLIPALASNPALYPALREWLEQHPDPAIPAVVAAQEQVSEVQEVPEVPEEAVPEEAQEAPEEVPEVPEQAPSIDDPLPEAAPVSRAENKSSRSKRVLIALSALLVAVAAFGGYQVVNRDDEAVLKKPAPVGALNVSGFSSRKNISGSRTYHEGNLQCQFTQDDDGKDLVKCTVWKYTFDPGVDCSVPGAPVTYELYAEGPVTKRCDKTDAVSGMPKGVYGTAMAQNGFACTLEEHNGIICWSEKSGEGFQVQKRLDRTF